MTWPYQGLSDALAGRPEDVLARWLRLYRESPLRLRSGMGDDEVSVWFAPVLESLTEALAPCPRPDGRMGLPAQRLVPGHADVREIEKAAAFLGARLAAEGVSGFDVAAVFTTLRDSVAALCGDAARLELEAFVEWLAIVAVDAMGTARVQALRERTRDELERGTPVVLLAPDVVGVFLIGRPDAIALESIFARVILRVARVGARAVVVDLSGLASEPSEAVLEAVGRFVRHRKVAGQIAVWLAGTTPDTAPLWSGVASQGGGTTATAGSFEEALENAFESSDFRLVRRATRARSEP